MLTPEGVTYIGLGFSQKVTSNRPDSASKDRDTGLALLLAALSFRHSRGCRAQYFGQCERGARLAIYVKFA